MKNKHLIFVLTCLAAAFAGVAVFLIYIKFTSAGALYIPLNALQLFALPLIGIILAFCLSALVIAPLFYSKEVYAVNEPGIGSKCCGFAAWCFIALSLSAIVASPLAETSYYIGYGVLFAFFGLACTLVTFIPYLDYLTEKAVQHVSPLVFALASLILAFIPCVGIYPAAASVTASVAAFRSNESPVRYRTFLLILSIFSFLIFSAVTISFVSLLFIK